MFVEGDFMKFGFKKIVFIVILTSFLSLNTAQSTDFSGEGIIGYNGGFGFQSRIDKRLEIIQPRCKSH